MNASNDNPSRIDQRLFDLLVDGELSEPRRCELLASLDQTQDGWRRCALAFLEAQCLARELGPISRVRPTQPRTEERAADGVSPGRPWRTLLAVAASFFLALGLGICWRSLFVSEQGFVSQSVEVAEVPESGPPRAPAVSDAVDDPEENPDSWQMVSFSVSDGSDQGKMIQLPAVERDTIGEAWLTNLPQGMPPDVVRAIEESGHQVRSQRRLMPLRMEDGRRLVIPVDQVELHYVGAPAYY